RARQATNDRGQSSRTFPALGLGQSLVAFHDLTEGLGSAALGEEPLGGADDLQGVGLTLLAGLGPGGDAVAAEDRTDGLRVLFGDLGDVQTELEAGATPGHPHDTVTEALTSETFSVHGGGQG